MPQRESLAHQFILIKSSHCSFQENSENFSTKIILIPSNSGTVQVMRIELSIV